MRQLRDVGILAVFAAKVTTGSRNGIGKASWKEVEERLLFNGVDVPGDHLVIDKSVQYAVPVLAYGANTAFARHYKAAMTAQAALDLLRLSRLLEHCLLHGPRSPL